MICPDCGKSSENISDRCPYCGGWNRDRGDKPALINTNSVSSAVLKPPSFSCFLCLVTFIISLVLVTYLSINLMLEMRISEIVGNTPESFPVLVVTPTDKTNVFLADVIYYKDINKFIAKNPDYSFLVPEDNERELRDFVSHMRKDTDRDNGKGEIKTPFYKDFRVLNRENGKQYLQVRGDYGSDYDNTGWYTATDKQIYPKNYRSVFGPALAIPAFFISIVISLILSICVTMAFIHYRKKKYSLVSERSIRI